MKEFLPRRSPEDMKLLRQIEWAVKAIENLRVVERDLKEDHGGTIEALEEWIDVWTKQLGGWNGTVNKDSNKDYMDSRTNEGWSSN